MQANALNRLEDVVVDCGGKGVNVSAMIQALGSGSVATGFAGGGAGEELLSRNSAKGFHHDFVRIKAITRTNLKVVDKNGALTELNEPGPEVTPEEYRMLETKLAFFANEGSIFVLSGSLCRGLGPDTYQRLCAGLRAKEAAVFLDADGDALKLALNAGPKDAPDFIKPNQYEILKLFGVAEDEEVTEKLLLDLAYRLLEKGPKLCALSLGSRGALFVNKQGAWRAPALNVQVQSTVGAGDSMVGALVYGFEAGLAAEQCFALAIAASAGACTTKGTNPPDRALVDELLKQVRLEKIA
jgi:1-phosphofructokinase